MHWTCQVTFYHHEHASHPARSRWPEKPDYRHGEGEKITQSHLEAPPREEVPERNGHAQRLQTPQPWEFEQDEEDHNGAQIPVVNSKHSKKSGMLSTAYEYITKPQTWPQIGLQGDYTKWKLTFLDLNFPGPVLCRWAMHAKTPVETVAETEHEKFNKSSTFLLKSDNF